MDIEKIKTTLWNTMCHEKCSDFRQCNPDDGCIFRKELAKQIASLDEYCPQHGYPLPCQKCKTLPDLVKPDDLSPTYKDYEWGKKLVQPDKNLLLTDEEIKEELKKYFPEELLMFCEPEFTTVSGIIAIVRKAQLSKAEPLVRADEASKYQVYVDRDKLANENAEKWYEQAKADERKKTLREVIKWLQDYAIHGSQTPLELVLDDLEIHSPYFKEAQLKSSKEVK